MIAIELLLLLLLVNHLILLNRVFVMISVVMHIVLQVKTEPEVLNFALPKMSFSSRIIALIWFALKSAKHCFHHEGLDPFSDFDAQIVTINMETI